MHSSYPTLNSVHEIYEQFKDGDIVFSKDYTMPCYALDHFTLYFNDGIAHTGCIIVENGVKYYLNSVPHTNHPKGLILKTYDYMGSKWAFIKEPLLDYILKYKCIYQVYRPPATQPSMSFSEQTLPNKLTYCSQIIGYMLYKTNRIEHASYLLTPYTPDDLIKLLLDKHYTYFYFKQS
jgi:hypothetical protein